MNSTKIILSGSVNGRMIPVAAVATPGTLIHTAISTVIGPSTIDELHLWAVNVTGLAATVTIQWGGVAAPADHLTTAFIIAANSAPVKLADGFPLVSVSGTTNIVRAFSGIANAINIVGYVNRIARTVYASKVGGPT
jgi:hypothetical protein